MSRFREALAGSQRFPTQCSRRGTYAELTWIGCDDARKVIVDPHRPVVSLRPAENVGSDGKPMAKDGYGNVHGLEIAQLCIQVDDLG
jgi:hypothetical protein